MVADGLTKPLSAINYAKFIKQLRLKVIKIDWQNIRLVTARINTSVGGYVARATKALIVSKLIAIFYFGDRKS